MEKKNGKYKITGKDICLAVGIVMALAGVYWMWFDNNSESSTTTACCCFCAAAVLFFNRSRKSGK